MNCLRRKKGVGGSEEWKGQDTDEEDEKMKQKQNQKMRQK